MSEIELVRGGEIVDRLNLSESEPISGTTFQALLEEHGKLLLGRVQTRDKANFRKKYYHYLYGPNLIKILFSVLQMPTT